MANMDDEEMTAEEFDARAAAGESVQLNVMLQRQKSGALYRVAFSTQHGFASKPPTRAVVRNLVGTTAGSVNTGA